MKIICIKSYHESNGPRPCNYNIGKIYTIHGDVDGEFIEDDCGRRYWWHTNEGEFKEHFKLLEDIREERINEILS